MPDLGDQPKLTWTLRDPVTGALTDATVTITQTTPTGGITNPAVTHDSLGVYSYRPDLTILGTWTFKWEATGTIEDDETLTLDVTSNPRYFGLGDLRLMPGLSNTTTYPDWMLSVSRDWIESLVERFCHTSFVAKPRSEYRSGADTPDLVLSSAHAIAVTGLVINGVTQDATAISNVVVEPGGVIYRRVPGSTYTWLTWPYGDRNISVTYTAGYSQVCPGDLREAMLAAARLHVLETRGSSGIQSRALSISTDDGNVTFAAASKDRPTGLPEADSVILGWRAKTALYGFSQ